MAVPPLQRVGIGTSPDSTGRSSNAAEEHDKRQQLQKAGAAFAGLEDPNEAINLKKLLNYITNGGAAALNFLHFLNSNWTFSEFLKEKLKFASSLMTRTAVLTQGGLLASEMWKTRNLIPLIGTILEFPVGLFSGDGDIWFNRGGPQGLEQFFSMIGKRHKKDANGNTLYVEGKPVCMDSDFKTGNTFVDTISDFIESGKVTVSESFKIASELFHDPKNFFNYSHSIFVASTGQIFGTALGLIGKIYDLPIVTTIGALWRDVKGTIVDFALTRDDEHKVQEIDKSTGEVKKPKLEFFNLDFTSTFVWAGLTWVLAAVVDAYKRIPVLSSGVSALTNLSLTSDRFASMLFTQANLTMQQRKYEKEIQMTIEPGGGNSLWGTVPQ